jgi:hypothetical protein
MRMVNPRCPDDILPSVGLSRSVGAQRPRRDITVERKEGLADVRRGGEGGGLKIKKKDDIVSMYTRLYFGEEKTNLGAIAGVRDVRLRPLEDEAGRITSVGRNRTGVVREESVIDEREVVVVGVDASGWASLTIIKNSMSKS